MSSGWDTRLAWPGRILTLAATLLVAAASPSGAGPRDLPPISPDEPTPASSSARRGGDPVFLEEGFEGVDFPPLGWVKYGNPVVPDSATWSQTADPPAVHGGVQAALVRWQSFRSQDEKLVTPRIDLAGFPSPDLRLSFWYRGEPFFAQYADLQVHVSSDSSTWTELWKFSDLADSGWAWREEALDIGPWAGGDLWTRFRYKGRDGADVALDDVRIGYAVPPAPPANDDCAGAAGDPVLFEIGPGAGTFLVTGANPLATADYGLPDAGASCTGATCAGKDLVWRVRIPPGHQVLATMDTAGNWDDTLFLVEDCADPVGTCVAGDRQIPDGSTVQWDNPDAGERVLWMIASAWAAGTGEFSVSGSIEPSTSIQPETWGRLKARYR